MKVAVLFSGGKDSTYALYKVLQEGHEIKYLITIFPKDTNSWMFHYPCVELTKLQSEALEIKQIMKKTSGEKEKELSDLKEVLKKIKSEVNGLVTGAIASNYQKSRIDKICEELGLVSISPLWQKDPEEYLKEEISNGFKIIITSVSSEGFDKSWLGRIIDEKCLEDLKKLKEKYKINISAEGGEFETFVLDCPIFKKRIIINSFDKIWDEKTSSGYIEVKDVRLVSK